MRASGLSKIVDYLYSLYARVRGGSRVCTSRRGKGLIFTPGAKIWRSSDDMMREAVDEARRAWAGRSLADRPYTQSSPQGGYSEPAVRGPAESPDTAPIIASVRVGGWTVDDLNTYLAKHPDGS